MIQSHLASAIKRNESQKNQRKLLKIFVWSQKDSFTINDICKAAETEKNNMQKIISSKSMSRLLWKWATENGPVEVNALKLYGTKRLVLF